MTDDELEQRLRAWYKAEIPVTEAAPSALRSRLQAIPVAAPAAWRRGGARGRGFTLLAAAALVGIVAGTAVVGGPSPTPSATPETSGRPSQPAVVIATPTPTAEVLSLDLTWTEVDLDANDFQLGLGNVAWLGDRFALRDDEGNVSTSLDGATWTALQPGDPDPGYADLLWNWTSVVSWEDTLVGWWNPEDGPDIAGKPPISARDILRIVQPPAQPTVTTPFKGRIESIGIGPMGIVAQVHSDLDWDAWVTKKLGLRTNNDWTCCVRDVTFQNGVLQIELSNGPGLNVVWADEGFLPGDYQDRGFGWFSPDGVEWTAIPSDIPPSLDSGNLPAFPTGLGEVVGVSDGFVASGVTPEDTCTLPDGCGPMWHSADGLTWRNLGPGGPESHDGRLRPWRGGALMTDGNGLFGLWTSEGYSELRMASTLPQVSAEFPTYAPFATGPLGFVAIRQDSNEVLLSRDGVEWKLQPMPAAVADIPGGDKGSKVVVGDRSVIYLRWSGYYGEGFAPSLWVGSVEP